LTSSAPLPTPPVTLAGGKGAIVPGDARVNVVLGTIVVNPDEDDVVFAPDGVAVNVVVAPGAVEGLPGDVGEDEGGAEGGI